MCIKSFKIAKQIHYILPYVLCVQIVHILLQYTIVYYSILNTYTQIYYVQYFHQKCEKLHCFIFLQILFFCLRRGQLDAHVSFWIQSVEISQCHVASGNPPLYINYKEIRVQKENTRHNRSRGGRGNMAAWKRTHVPLLMLRSICKIQRGLCEPQAPPADTARK